MLGRMFSAKAREPQGPPDYRAYAIGDIHGHLDLLDRLLVGIRADHHARSPAEGILILLGDLIDRGPDSAGVVECLRTFDDPAFRVIGLAGNHEEILLRILDGEASLVADWLQFGGAECLQSYGVDPDALALLPAVEQMEAVQSAIPRSHEEFLQTFGDTFSFGDFLFVHAGIRPGIALEDQSPRDLRWIRHEFLDDGRDHGFVVVHGHTISKAVDDRPNRIGIDTGAYAGGPLTALGVETGSRWLLQVGGQSATAFSGE